MPLVLPDLSKVPITGLSGIAAILVFCLFSGISIASYPGGFTPIDMWLGDYGFPDINPAGAAYYNLGSMLTGLLLIVFYTGLYQHSVASPARTSLRTAGQAAGVFSGISLFIAGYLTPAVMPGNLIASYAFFALTFLAIIFLHMAFRSRPFYSEATACMGLASVALIVLLGVTQALASIEPIVAEWCALFALISWIGLTSRDSYRRARGRCHD
ncbi:hypothetical protein [Methanocella arvoryzae]|uniref:DUF998 domain-containing protein n=1 Tax=Methanocella arvoryzae (strain DSM 22066 / NBRC 105507 / MRE50) TaxID=351160 RepID=Q0W6R0_METAR|nr:hypothetical protein [Methanocella arvoryzae]CAJ35933.1 hypothetical protein RCIX507 [Methanocella arvoryzae MRE50]